MKISVCVCAYNAEKTLARTLDSVFAQSYPDYEIVLINDGSTDQTLPIAERYRSEHPESLFIKSIPNGGLANARNEALALCTGELYINLDADDYLEPDTFEKAVAVLNSDPLIDVCFYGYKEFDESGSFFGSYSSAMHYIDRPVTGLQAYQLRLKRYLWICQGNAVYRMSLIRENGIRNHSGKNQGEDMYFISRCLLAANKVFCFQGDNFCCMTRSDSMNHASYNPSFFQTLELMDLLEQDVRCDHADKLDEILPYLYAERIVQTLAIIKRMARVFPLRKYRAMAKALQKRLKPYDAAAAVLLPDKTKRVEYRLCSASLAAYYGMTRLHDRVH